MAFIGRTSELETLARLWRKQAPSLVVCSGRRRIGKSTLVEEFAARSGCRFLEFEGLAPDKGMTDDRQRNHFLDRLAEPGGTPPIRAVLVYEGTLSPSVVEDGYFDFAIPAETLLGRGPSMP